MSLLLVAHGTRKQQGVAMIGDLAQRVSQVLDNLGVPPACRGVHVGFVDVLGPTPSEVLASEPTIERPTIVVPAFLSRGYHVVGSDIPAHIAAGGHPDVTVTAALGPGPEMVRVLGDRLVESGWRRDDSVILAAAGTSDPHCCCWRRPRWSPWWSSGVQRSARHRRAAR